MAVHLIFAPNSRNCPRNLWSEASLRLAGVAGKLDSFLALTAAILEKKIDGVIDLIRVLCWTLTSRSTRLVFVNYQVYEISGNSNGGLFWKRGEHKNVIPFCVLLSFLDCIHTDSEVQTGATLFKITLKVELLSCFDGKPKTRAGEKIIAVEINK